MRSCTRLVRDLQLQLGTDAPTTNIVETNTTLQAMTAMPASSVNWKALGRWILLLALIITVGAIAITGANRDRDDHPQLKRLPDPPNPPAPSPPSQ